jgi:hypothetical protein
MNDQQQRLANLVHAAFSAGHAAGQESDTDHHAAFQSWQEDADVLGAIAAMTAEPTEAEALEAACERGWNRIMGARAYSWKRLIEESNPDWQPAIDDHREATREAIALYLAARTTASAPAEPTDAEIDAMSSQKKWTAERVPPPDMTNRERYDAIGRMRKLIRHE